MPKTEVIPCTKEEIDRILDASMGNDFFYMLFMVAKTTGRRLGELYGNQEKIIVREERYKDRLGNIKVKEIKKGTGKYSGGVQVKDIILRDNGTKIMMTQVLKKRRRAEKEAVLTDEVYRLIKTYISKHRLSLDDYLFRKVGYRQIQNKIIHYSKKAKIQHKVVFHNFRHYLITELIRKGWSYDKIAKVTGHTTIGVISVYDHVVASDIRDDILNDLKDI